MGASNGAEARRAAVTTAAARHPREFEAPRDGEGRIRVSGVFGSKTFDLRRMRDKLPHSVYDKLLGCIDRGEPLDPGIAGAVAHAAKEWAIESGATHFCHWFQPLTGLTAEKHDAFLKVEDGVPLEGFDGSQLIQSEPDASSFPSGGMRTTFEARGYTAWDPSSPMFLRTTRTGCTLCIPSAYMSYHGAALDEKTGLLRSVHAVNAAVKELFEVLGHSQVVRIATTLGPEQEYFLVDRVFLPLRPDLLLSGRTVLGASSAKGQQLEDHYFGSIPTRVLSFMAEFEHELFQLGVPVKTRHNEVAPGQYESAPIFEEANVAADHNQLTMEIMRQVALRHELTVLFHEKPFAGINGTGKHLNWSLAAKHPDGSWDNLFEPGDTPEENLRFLLMIAAALRAVHRRGGCLRAGISGSGNDHRLGANEAPPAIISVFLGSTLSGIFDRLAQGSSGRKDATREVLSLGVDRLPQVRRDNTDRNRTSPFAFTGNKFEFRACGGSMAVSFPVTVLNAAMADALKDMTAEIKSRIDAGEKVDLACVGVLQSMAAETRAIRFEGDNYSDAWVAEAESRGLPNLRKTSDALDWLAKPENHGFLVDLGVFTADEVKARCHVRTERYLKDIDIEFHTLLQLLDTAVTPAASSYQGELLATVLAAKSAGVSAPQEARARQIGELLAELDTHRDSMVRLKGQIDAGEGSESQKAHRYAYDLSAAMQKARTAADAIEALCGDDHWPLPRYMEMLFVR